MIFQNLIYILEVLKWKKVAALEDNNRIDNWQSWQYFYLMNNLGFTIKAIRKASTHLTEEPYYIVLSPIKRLCLPRSWCSAHVVLMVNTNGVEYEMPYYRESMRKQLIVAMRQIYSLFPILDLFIGVFSTYIAEKYVNLHLY